MVIVGFANGEEPDAFGLAAVATLQDHHWWLNREGIIFLDLLTAYPTWGDDQNWLPDGRYLWIAEDHNVYISNENGRENLNAPEPMASIEYATGGIAFADTRNGTLWRVDVANQVWEKVEAAAAAEAEKLGDGFFAVAQDGSYGLNFQREQMWRVPVEMGIAAEPLPGVDVERLPGSGGGGYPSMIHLRDSPYWLINSAILLTGHLQEGVSAHAFLIDVSDSHLIVAKDLALSSELLLVDFSAPPDGTWVAASLFNHKEEQHVGLYLAPSRNLASGQLINSSDLSVVGWHTNPPTVIFRDEAARNLSVAALPLTDETSATPLPGAGELLTTLPGSIITTAADNPARVLQFGLDGSLLNSLDLSSQYESVEVARGAAEGVYLAAIGHQSQEITNCSYGLIEWTLNGE